MPKRQQRLHLDLDHELNASGHKQARTDVNLHAHERHHRPDPHRERKHVRRALHDMEWRFEEGLDDRLDEIA